MSTSNEKPEDGNTKAKGQQHDGALDADAGEALDMNALEAISGGADRRERPLIIEVEKYDPNRSVSGVEGVSGA